MITSRSGARDHASRAPGLPTFIAADAALLAVSIALGWFVATTWPAAVHIPATDRILEPQIAADTWHIARANLLVGLALLSGICTFGTFTVVVLAWNGYLLGVGLAGIGRTAPDLLPLMLRYVPLEFGAFVLIAAVSHYVTSHLARVLAGRSTRTLGAPTWAAALAVCLLVLGAWVEAHVKPQVGTALAYTEHADGP